jgi:hypothetical protein
MHLHPASAAVSGRRSWRGRVVAYTTEQSLKGHSHEILESSASVPASAAVSGRRGWVVAYTTEQSLKGHSHEILNHLHLHPASTAGALGGGRVEKNSI